MSGIQVKAYAAKQAKAPIEPYEFKRRNPGSDDIVIDIEYCGICHSDIHQARNEWAEGLFPMVPGHEIVGKVIHIGDNVRNFTVGETVGVGCLVDSCRQCQSCESGLEQYCENGFVATYNSKEKDGKTVTQGGYSTKIVVDKRFVLHVPSNLDPAEAAPLLCAGITTYSPLNFLQVKHGSKVAVVGLGGLGHMAVKIAKAMGAEVSVISRSNKKKEDALKLKANRYIISSDSKEMESIAGTFDVVIDTVSAKHDIGQIANCCRREGTVVLLGVADEPLDLPPFPLIAGRRSIMGSLIGGLPETQEMLDFCGKHNITSDIELIEPGKINEAFARTVAGDVKFRFVIDCKKI